MLIIRLVRTGKKNAPSFRLVLVKKTAPPKSGRFLEILGSYNPRRLVKKGAAPGQKEVNLRTERIKHWLAQGVQTSETVHNLLVSQGIIKGPKIKKKIPTKKKSAAKGEAEKEEKLAEGKESSQSPVAEGTIEEKKEPMAEEKKTVAEEKTGKEEEKREKMSEEKKEDGKETEETEKKEGKPKPTQKKNGLDKSKEKSKIEGE